MKAISPGAFALLTQAAVAAHANPHDWALLIYEESAWDPARRNGSGAPYYGLNQAGVHEIAGMGFHGSIEDWLRLSTEAQLPYVTTFFRQKVSACGDVVLASAAHMLAANFLPGRMGKSKGRLDPSDIDYPLCIKGEGTNFYEQNAVYDPTHKGTITIRDMAKFLNNLAAKNPHDVATLRAGVSQIMTALRIPDPGGHTDANAFAPEPVKLGAVEVHGSPVPPSAPEGAGASSGAGAWGAVIALGLLVGGGLLLSSSKRGSGA